MKNLLLILLLAISANSYCQVSRSFENDDLKPFKEGNLYGFKNKAGEIVVQPRYERIYEFHEGMCRVRRGYVNCYIDSTGKEVNINLLDKGTNYHEIGDFHDGLALINYCDNKRHCGYGYIDKNGVLVSEDIYGLANNYSEGRAFVCKWNSRKWEIIDEKGNNIGSEKYDHIGELTRKVYIFSEGLALVRCKNNWKYIDTAGKTIKELGTETSEYVAINKWFKNCNEPEAKNQLAMVEGSKSNASIYTATEDVHQNKDGVTKNLTFELDLQKDSFAQIPRLYVNEDEYYVKGGKAYNRQGKLVLSSEKYLIKSYSDGRFRVISQNNLYGFVDILGNEIIPCQYEDARDFRDGVARVCKKIASDRVRKWGYIDKNGKQVLPFSYGHVSGDFSQGLAYVAKSNQSSIINKKGEIVKNLKISNYNLTPPGDHFLPRVANYTYFSEGVIWLSVGNRLFLVNTNGVIEKEIDLKEIEKAFNGKLWEVDEVYPFKRGLSLLRFEDYDNKIKIGYLYNKDGNVVAKYDFVNNKVFDEYKSDTTAIVKMAEYFYDNDRLDSSLELFRQASSLGNSRAQYIVGFMYQYGQGAKVNEQEAIKWYTKSNEPEAKKQLAMIESKEKIQEPIKKEEPILLADTKVQNNNSEIVTPQTPVESKTVIAKTSQDKIVAQNTSQVQEQSKQPTPVEKKKEKRIALVIGNSDYNEKMGLHPLTTPISDAYDMKKKLESIGFEDVVARTNLPYDRMKIVVEQFCDKAEGYDVALFYYSGHAVQHESHSILLPIGKRFENNSDFRDYSFNIEDILHDLKGDDEKQVRIFIIDACRDRYNDRYKGHTEDVKNFEPKEGEKRCFYAYATRLFEKAEDGSIRNLKHSPFTEVLLEKIDSSDLTINQLFEEVEKEVYYELTDKKQEPRHNNNLPMDLKNFTFLIK